MAVRAVQFFNRLKISLYPVQIMSSATSGFDAFGISAEPAVLVRLAEDRYQAMLTALRSSELPSVEDTEINISFVLQVAQNVDATDWLRISVTELLEAVIQSPIDRAVKRRLVDAIGKQVAAFIGRVSNDIAEPAFAGVDRSPVAVPPLELANESEWRGFDAARFLKTAQKSLMFSRDFFASILTMLGHPEVEEAMDLARNLDAALHFLQLHLRFIMKGASYISPFQSFTTSFFGDGHSIDLLPAKPMPEPATSKLLLATFPRVFPLISGHLCRVQIALLEIKIRGHQCPGHDRHAQKRSRISCCCFSPATART